MMSRAFIIFIGVVALVVAILLGGLNLYLGPLNQDEGWYLYAAGQVADGQVLYRDFAFTQAPVLPFVYALASPIVNRWGIAGGRFVTALFGLLTAVCASRLAARFVPRKWSGSAAVLAFTLVAVNVYQNYYTVVVKTYALCGLFLTLGILSLTFIQSRGRIAECFLSGVFLALAAGTRLSAGIALPIVGLYLFVQQRRFGAGWFSFGIGGGLTLLGLFLPFYLIAPEGFLFGVLEYHTLRSPGSLPYLLALKAGFVSRVVQDYFVAIVLLIVLIVLRQCWKPGKEVDKAGVSIALVWAVVIGVTAVHFMAPFPYDDYQVVIFPVMAAAVSAGLLRWALSVLSRDVQERFVAVLLGIVLLASVASAFSSPINQDWMIRGRDRIWWRMKDESDLGKLQAAGRWLRERTEPGDTLLTQDAYLAVEAGLKVPHGMELGPFSFYPDWDRERAESLNVLNREMMIDVLVASDAEFAAMSGYGLSIRCPEVSEVPEAEQGLLYAYLEDIYEEVREIPYFGQAHTTLRLYKKRNDTP